MTVSDSAAEGQGLLHGATSWTRTSHTQIFSLLLYLMSYRGNLFGAGEGSRTLDIYLGKVVLYQLSYARKLYLVDVTGVEPVTCSVSSCCSTS
jgi:hypothetical protein